MVIFEEFDLKFLHFEYYHSFLKSSPIFSAASLSDVICDINYLISIIINHITVCSDLKGLLIYIITLIIIDNIFLLHTASSMPKNITKSKYDNKTPSKSKNGRNSGSTSKKPGASTPNTIKAGPKIV